MVTKLLFEDNEDTPSSMLLKHSYCGDSIYFSGGCHQILSKLMEIKDASDVVIIFYDVSPNNKYTVKYYNSLVQDIKSNPAVYGSVCIIPIICIEYYICQFLNKYGYMCIKNKNIQNLVEAIVTKFDYREIPSQIASIQKLNMSLEKMYKYIVNNQDMKCLLNVGTYDNGIRVKSLSGKFYEDDCSCERKYCKINCKDSISLKVERLYTELPVFPVKSDEHRELLKSFGINVVYKGSKEVRACIQDLYDYVCQNMGVNSIKVII